MAFIIGPLLATHLQQQPKKKQPIQPPPPNGFLLHRAVVQQSPGPTIEETLLYTAVYRPVAFDLVVRTHMARGMDENRRMILWAARCCADDPRQLDRSTALSKAKVAFHSVFIHVKPVQKAPVEKQVMDTYSAFAIATFVEIILKNMHSQTSSYHCRSQTWLPRSLHYNGKTKMVAVIADKSMAYLAKEGSFKESVDALLLSASQPEELTRHGVHSITKPTCIRGAMRMLDILTLALPVIFPKIKHPLISSKRVIMGQFGTVPQSFSEMKRVAGRKRISIDLKSLRLVCASFIYLLHLKRAAKSRVSLCPLGVVWLMKIMIKN